MEDKKKKKSPDFRSQVLYLRSPNSRDLWKEFKI